VHPNKWGILYVYEKEGSTKIHNTKEKQRTESTPEKSL